MKCMHFARLAVAAATVLSGSTLMAATLNVPYSAGYVRSDCTDSKQGGVRLETNAPPSAACWIDIPLPIESGHLIQQVAVYYGTDGSQSDVQAYLGYKDLRAAAMNDAFEGAELFKYGSTTNVAPAGMALGNLMSQSQTGVTYPDAFEMEPSYAYFVRVMLRKDSDLFGVRVTYR